MGPGCFYPGNSASGMIVIAPFTLQWGRDVSIPEMVAVRRVGVLVLSLQWGRDVSIPEMALFTSDKLWV